MKEDAANKSSDVTLSDLTGAKFPTELAVKTFVETKVVDNITSGIISSAPTQNAVYNALASKEDAGNKKNVIIEDDSTTGINGSIDKFPTEFAVQNYVNVKIQRSKALTLDNMWIGNGGNNAEEISTIGSGDVVRETSPTLETPFFTGTTTAEAIKATSITGNGTSGTLSINGDTTLNGIFGVNGTTLLGDDLTVTGNTTINFFITIP